MTDQTEDGTEAIRRQFAELQAAMKQAMAEPPPPQSAFPPPPLPDAALDFERIERGLDELRRDADLLRTRLAAAANAAPTADSTGPLRARIEEIGRQSEDHAARLIGAMQANREAVAALSLRLDTLARRRQSRILVPLAILLGAVIIAGAVLASSPGALDGLIDRAATLVGARHPPAP